MRVRTEQRNFRANIVRRMQPAFAQDMRRHGGRRRLAMHACDHDSALARHDRGQRLGAADQRLSASRALTRIGFFSLIAEEKMTSSASFASFRAMLRMKAQPQPLQAIDFERTDLVGTAHVMPELEQKRGDTAHPAPRHPHQVNPVMLAREEWQIAVDAPAQVARQSIQRRAS